MNTFVKERVYRFGHFLPLFPCLSIVVTSDHGDPVRIPAVRSLMPIYSLSTNQHQQNILASTVSDESSLPLQIRLILQSE